MGFKFKSKIDYNRLNKSLFNTNIYVGYSEDETHYSGYSAAELGKLLSEGDGYAIPPRPHINEGLEAGRSDIRHAIRKYGGGLFGLFPKENGIYKVAEAARQAVITYIQSGALEANARYTIEKKGSDTPLIDKGELVHLLEAIPVKGGL